MEVVVVVVGLPILGGILNWLRTRTRTSVKLDVEIHFEHRAES
jgi:hypothetical protein